VRTMGSRAPLALLGCTDGGGAVVHMLAHLTPASQRP
jgi:hypothetical protein